VPDATADHLALVVDCVGRRLSLGARAARQVLEAHLAGVGMTYAGFAVLAALRQQQPMMQRELAHWLDVEAPTLTRQLERLERQRLVARRHVDSDRRVTLVELTSAGRATIDRLQPIVARAAQQVAADLSPGEVQRLSELLGRLARK
jgi:DNA-binding MarR family transcriptional regulator